MEMIRILTEIPYPAPPNNRTQLQGQPQELSKFIDFI